MINFALNRHWARTPWARAIDLGKVFCLLCRKPVIDFGPFKVNLILVVKFLQVVFSAHAHSKAERLFRFRR